MGTLLEIKVNLFGGEGGDRYKILVDSLPLSGKLELGAKVLYFYTCSILCHMGKVASFCLSPFLY